jgi:hypothetical protein
VSEGEGAPEGAPVPILEPKTFEVWWANPDAAVTMYSGITGSNLEGDVLVLVKPDGRENIINLAHVRSVHIWNDA